MRAALTFAAIACVAILAPPVCAIAGAFTIWNFNSPVSDTNTSSGTTVPSTGSGTAATVGGTTNSFSTGSTDDPAPASDNSGWETKTYPAQATGNKTAGVQFNVNTLGYSNIVVRWSQRVTSSASKYYRLQYSTDGSSFTDYPNSVAATVASVYEAQTNSLAAITGVNSNANFAFRIVSEFQSTATGSGSNGYVTVSGGSYGAGTGTIRFDMVTVSGTLIPGANTPPTISSLSDQTIRVTQSSTALAFTIGDAQDTASSLTLDKASSNPSVIPASNIVFGGSGSGRTVTITAGSQIGSATITLYVVDTGGQSNSTVFTVTVLPLNTPPVISAIPPANTIVNTAAPAIGFTIGDQETPAGSLMLSGSSANLGLVPNGNIAFGGSGSNRTVTVTPAAGQTGVAVVTVTVSDGTNTASSVFPVMVTPSATVILYEPFTYPDGPLLTNSGFVWQNRSGTLGECQVTNSQLQVTAAQTEDVIASLIGAPYAVSSNTVLYASFRAMFLTLPKSSPGQFAEFSDGSTLRGRVYAGTAGAAPGAFRLFTANGSDSTTVLATDLNLNTTYTVVTRYNIDSASTMLWVNPASESDPGVMAADPQSALRITSYGFRQDTDIGATMLVDDLRVGLAFSDVVPGATASPIRLNSQLIGGKVVLTWTNSAFALQSAPGVGGSYTNVPGASSPYTNTFTSASRFFRLKE